MSLIQVISQILGNKYFDTNMLKNVHRLRSSPRVEVRSCGSSVQGSQKKIDVRGKSINMRYQANDDHKENRQSNNQQLGILVSAANYRINDSEPFLYCQQEKSSCHIETEQQLIRQIDETSRKLFFYKEMLSRKRVRLQQQKQQLIEHHEKIYDQFIYLIQKQKQKNENSQLRLLKCMPVDYLKQLKSSQKKELEEEEGRETATFNYCI